MIPEQVWDADDIPEHMLFNGHPAGSGMPLVWAHAEYIKLLRSLHGGAVWDFRHTRWSGISSRNGPQASKSGAGRPCLFSTGRATTRWATLPRSSQRRSPSQLADGITAVKGKYIWARGAISAVSASPISN